MKTARGIRLLLAWLMVAATSHGRFVPAPDGPVPFRRDLIPLDVATMTDLSQRLTSMALARPMDSPAERRDTARMLALATALDPQNNEARELAADYRKNKRPANPPEAPATAPLWRTIAWLETPDAGTHGQALGTLLLDIAALADPDHPRARAHHDESDGWDGWIPPLAAYTAPVSPPRERVVPEDIPEEPAAGDGEAPPLPEATVRTVIWQKSGPADSTTRIPTVVALRMHASLLGDGSDNPTPLRVGPRRADGEIDRTSLLISRLLAARGTRIPENLRVRITCPEYEAALAAVPPQPIGAAAAVLANAAITGTDPDALILGEVDSNGGLSLPPDFWKILNALGPDDGRRLILPKAAMDWLPSLLAMEKAEFFLDHEVLAARNFDELVALCAKRPAGEIAAAGVLFADIRKRGLDGDVRDYLSNRFVRQRLDELSQQAPWHASANMLHTQSAGRRPVTVNRAVLAAELRMAIQPMAAIAAAAARREFIEEALTAAEAASIGGIHDNCRDEIDRFEKLTARTDQDLFQGARALAASLRALERTTRSRGEYEDVQLLIHRELRGFARQYHALEENLREQESGDSAD